MKWYWKLMFVAVPILALQSILVSDNVLAQTFLNKPSIEAVSYYELAEWRAMYGNSSLFGPRAPAYGAPVYYPGVCPPETFGNYGVQKRATRKGRK